MMCLLAVAVWRCCVLTIQCCVTFHLQTHVPDAVAHLRRRLKRCVRARRLVLARRPSRRDGGRGLVSDTSDTKPTAYALCVHRYSDTVQRYNSPELRSIPRRNWIILLIPIPELELNWLNSVQAELELNWNCHHWNWSRNCILRNWIRNCVSRN